MAKGEKVAVRYKGKKPSMPINFPIGAKNLSEFTRTTTVSAGGSVELSEEDAHRLVALDPHNFELPEGVECKYTKKQVLGMRKSDDDDGEAADAGEDGGGVEVPEGVTEYTPESPKKKGKKAKE